MTNKNVLTTALRGASTYLEDDDGGRLAAMLALKAVLEHLKELSIPRDACVPLDRLFGALDDVKRGVAMPEMFKSERSTGRAAPGHELHSLRITALVAVELYIRSGDPIQVAIGRVYRRLKNRRAVAGKSFDAKTIENWRESLSRDRLDYTDQLGHTVTTNYDAYMRPVRIDRGLNGVNYSTRYSYDLLGRMTGIQDAAGNNWSYTYDSLGRKTVANDPDLGRWTYQYDNADRLTQVTDALGQVTRYTYDAAGRTLTKTTRYGTTQAATTTYTYDQTFAAAPYGVGHLTTAADSNSTRLFAYNQIGQVIWQLWSADGANYTVIDNYSFGWLRWRTYYQGTTLLFSLGTSTSQWSYDGAGRLLSIPGVQTSATYNAAGQAVSVTRANGVTTAYSHNSNRQWLTEIRTTNAAGTQLQDLLFTGRDAKGRILRALSDDPNESWTYTYDEWDRLTQATNTGNAALSQSFSYDAIDRMTYNSALGSYVYPAAGQPHPHAVSQAGGHSYSYDANGNTLSDGTFTAVYDGENRLVRDNTGAFTYVYGPDGSRLKKIMGNVTTLYNGDDWEVTGGVSTFYLPGDAVMTNGVASWNVRDQINSVRLTTNGSGGAVQRAHYKPYGQRMETIASLMTSKGFIGERNDENGLVCLHARYLLPGLSLFITPDPSPDPTAPGVGLNRYAYAGYNPISNSDPSGLNDQVHGFNGLDRRPAGSDVSSADDDSGSTFTGGPTTVGPGRTIRTNFTGSFDFGPGPTTDTTVQVADVPAQPAPSYSGGSIDLVAGGGIGGLNNHPPLEGPHAPGWHDYYAGPNRVCGSNCSVKDMVDYVSRFAYPGQDPSVPAVTNNFYLVKDPWYGVPGGWVRTIISKDGLTVTNITTRAHALYNGQIVRTATFANGAWQMTTHGWGNNTVPGMNEVNQEYGPKIFDRLDEQMKEYILSDQINRSFF